MKIKMREYSINVSEGMDPALAANIKELKKKELKAGALKKEIETMKRKLDHYDENYAME